jgi:hypothetical protein
MEGIAALYGTSRRQATEFAQSPAIASRVSNYNRLNASKSGPVGGRMPARSGGAKKIQQR